MTNREAFEVWARAHHQNAEFLLPDTDVIRTLPVAWAVWQAAIAHAQQERKPMTYEEIDSAWRSVDYTLPYDVEFRTAVVREIEAHHDIK